MDDSDFQEIMQESLNETIQKIHRIYSDPERWPISLFTTYGHNDALEIKQMRIFSSLANYFLGTFESLLFTKLEKKYNYLIINEDKEQYIKNVTPFFEQLKNEIGKINNHIIDSFMDRSQTIDLNKN